MIITFLLSNQQDPILIHSVLINLSTNDVYMDKHDIQSVNTTSNHRPTLSTQKYINFYNNSIQFPIPALMVSGPPKTGTVTLLRYLSLYQDVMAYPVEHFYWGNTGFDKPHACSPIMDDTQWTNYLSKYESMESETSLLDLIDIIKDTNPRSKTKCTAKAFKNTYENVAKYRARIKRKRYGNMNATEIAKINARFIPKSCINPFKWKQKRKRGSSRSNKMYCWFVEKTPAYARTPYVPIYVAHELQQTKYLTILRNPINHVWSNYFHFAGGRSHKWRKDIHNTMREKDVISKFQNEKIRSIDILNGICNNISAKYAQIKEEDRKSRWLLMREDYKKLIIAYFRGRYIEPKDIHTSKVTKYAKLIWSTYYVPILFIGLYVNDEVFVGDNVDEWDPMQNEILNYRYIQFEWLWHDTLDSIRTLKCWMTQGYRLDNNKCEYERDHPLNQQYFGEVRKANSRGKGELSDWYKDQIVGIFGPCTSLIFNNLLNDRPNIFLGDWIPWDRFGN